MNSSNSITRCFVCEKVSDFIVFKKKTFVNKNLNKSLQ